MFLYTEEHAVVDRRFMPGTNRDTRHRGADQEDPAKENDRHTQESRAPYATAARAGGMAMSIGARHRRAHKPAVLRRPDRTRSEGRHSRHRPSAPWSRDALLR